MSEQAITHMAEMFSQLMQQQQAQQTMMLKGFEAVLKQSESFSANLVKSNARRTFPLTLETFDGSQSLPQWIMDVELKAKVNQIPEEEFGLWAQTALRGLAKQHLESLELTEWSEIKASLTQRFVPKNQNLVLRSKLLNLHENGSDISGYIHEFQILHAQLTDTISQNDLIFYFLKGLRSACKQHVYLQTVASLDEAMQLALHFENSNLSGNSMELDHLNSFSNSRRNNFSRRPNNFQRNNRSNFQKSHTFRNSNFRRTPRPFLNFSRVPSQNYFRRRHNQSQSNFGQSNSFRRTNAQHLNRQQPSYQGPRAPQSGVPRHYRPPGFKFLGVLSSLISVLK